MKTDMSMSVKWGRIGFWLVSIAVVFLSLYGARFWTVWRRDAPFRAVLGLTEEQVVDTLGNPEMAVGCPSAMQKHPERFPEEIRRRKVVVGLHYGEVVIGMNVDGRACRIWRNGRLVAERY
jgi:hypothetical protein